MVTKNTIQIDVLNEVESTGFMLCNLYVTGVAYKLLLNKSDYNLLNERGFFLRDGNNKDSAGVLNTTKLYIEK